MSSVVPWHNINCQKHCTFKLPKNITSPKRVVCAARSYLLATGVLSLQVSVQVDRISLLLLLFLLLGFFLLSVHYGSVCKIYIDLFSPTLSTHTQEGSLLFDHYVYCFVSSRDMEGSNVLKLLAQCVDSHPYLTILEHCLLVCAVYIMQLVIHCVKLY